MIIILDCEKCNGRLEIDEMCTVDEYNKDMNYLLDDLGEILDKSIQQYLVYKCSACGELYKYTYKDWEERIRKKVAKYVLMVRKAKIFKTIDPSVVSEDNGVSYCGRCLGYGNDGWCLNDIIRQCQYAIKKEA